MFEQYGKWFHGLIADSSRTMQLVQEGSCNLQTVGQVDGQVDGWVDG
jgi:hypothetical protein